MGRDNGNNSLGDAGGTGSPFNPQPRTGGMPPPLATTSSQAAAAAAAAHINNKAERLQHDQTFRGGVCAAAQGLHVQPREGDKVESIKTAPRHAPGSAQRGSQGVKASQASWRQCRGRDGVVGRATPNRYVHRYLHTSLDCSYPAPLGV